MPAMEWPHLLIDADGCEPAALRDPDLMLRFLDDLPDRIGMTKIVPPRVEETPLGLTGYVIIAESHVCAHTNAEARGLTVDIFSCRPFDGGPALRAVQGYWRAERYRTRMIDRSARSGRPFDKP